MTDGNEPIFKVKRQRYLLFKAVIKDASPE